MSMDAAPQINVKPRCPKCESTDCPSYKTQKVTLQHNGADHRASQQYRKCRECHHNFQTTEIGEKVRRGRVKTGSW